MNAEIDRLEVAVESSASKANAELNKLVNRLEKVARSLSKINGSGLTGFANGIEKLGKSLQTVNAVKTSDFTRLANNIKKISNIDQSGLNRTASALNVIGRSLNSAGNNCVYGEKSGKAWRIQCPEGYPEPSYFGNGAEETNDNIGAVAQCIKECYSDDKCPGKPE